MTFVKPSVATFSQQPLPTMYDLPSEHPEDAGLPDEFHWSQADLLKKTFQPTTYPADSVFSAADMNLYYDPQNHGYYKRPDWFGVVDVPRKIDDGRMSYVRWQERHSPIIVVELLSPRTTEEDQGLTLRGRTPPSKWEVYESILPAFLFREQRQSLKLKKNMSLFLKVRSLSILVTNPSNFLLQWPTGKAWKRAELL